MEGAPAAAGLPPQLLALAAHDLKNELGALEATLAQLAADQPALPAARRGHQQCRTLRQRLVMLLTLYGSQGHLRAWCEDDAPADLLLALQTRHAADGAHGPEVALDPQADPPPFAHYDARLVSLALEAALHNARRFAQGHVWLGARAHEGGLLWWVADDGPGPGAVETAAGRAAAQPTGLGTELCRAVAAAHRHAGRCGWVRLGHGPQGGALFEMWLP